MIKVSTRSLLILASLTWLFVGLFLLSFGLHLELTALKQPYFAGEEPFSLLAYLMPKTGTKQNALILILFLGLFIGYMKGKYVLKKTAFRQITRITSFKSPHSLSDLYTWKYALLIALMMSMGMALRFLPIHIDLRGAIDIAVGAALINGATHYFNAIKNPHTKHRV